MVSTVAFKFNLRRYAEADAAKATKAADKEHAKELKHAEDEAGRNFKAAEKEHSKVLKVGRCRLTL